MRCQAIHFIVEWKDKWRRGRVDYGAALEKRLGKPSEVRILSPPPIYNFRVFESCCLAPPEVGLGFGKDFEGIFEIQKQFLPAQTGVRTNLF